MNRYVHTAPKQAFSRCHGSNSAAPVQHLVPMNVKERTRVAAINGSIVQEELERCPVSSLQQDEDLNR